MHRFGPLCARVRSGSCLESWPRSLQGHGTNKPHSRLRLTHLTRNRWSTAMAEDETSLVARERCARQSYSESPPAIFDVAVFVISPHSLSQIIASHVWHGSDSWRFGSDPNLWSATHRDVRFKNRKCENRPVKLSVLEVWLLFGDEKRKLHVSFVFCS